MNDQELISALADGQLRGEDLARGVQVAAGSAQGRATWQAYHVIGEALRTGRVAQGATSEVFLARLQQRLREEQLVVVPAPVAVQPKPREAANDSFWKLVAGLASVAAVAAVGWNLWGSAAPSAQPQLASAPPAPAVTASAALAAAAPVRQAPVQAAAMIRDPRLDQLLSAHRQFGGGVAPHAPGGFVRNATFEGPAR